MVLGEARGFVGGSASAIFAKDAAATTLTVFHHDGGTRAALHPQIYYERYMALRSVEHRAFLLRAVEDADRPTADYIDYDEVPSRPAIYNEWSPAPGAWSISLTGGAREIDDIGGALRHLPPRAGRHRRRRRPKHRMRLIAPHVRRAVLIGEAIDLKAAQSGEPSPMPSTG